MNRECPVCHHTMTAGLVRHVQTWHDTVVVFEMSLLRYVISVGNNS
jgi:hypothetical protein